MTWGSVWGKGARCVSSVIFTQARRQSLLDSICPNATFFFFFFRRKTRHSEIAQGGGWSSPSQVSVYDTEDPGSCFGDEGRRSVKHLFHLLAQFEMRQKKSMFSICLYSIFSSFTFSLWMTDCRFHFVTSLKRMWTQGIKRGWPTELFNTHALARLEMVWVGASARRGRFAFPLQQCY